MEKIKIISSPKNNFIRFIRSLKKKKVSQEKGQFLIEGIKSVKEALKCNVDIPYFIYSPDLFRVKGGQDFFDSLKENHNNMIAVTEGVFNKLAETRTPQGIIAVPNRKNWNKDDLFSKDKSFIFIIDGIQDPGNLGTIIRIADSLMVDAVIVSDDTVDEYNAKTVRSTMGSIFRIPVFKSSNLGDYTEKIKQNGYKLIGTILDEDTFSYEKVDYASFDKIALIIGNESRGICADVKENVDIKIKIPVLSNMDSLNAAVATGISAYEIMKQKSWRL
ncbi:MAG: TrmH family RNA methyltransferase [Candidatus Muiribacteriota bacterium]